MSVFIKNGFFCIVQRNPNEIQEHFMHRGYAIVSQHPTSQPEFDKNVLLSNYFNNIKFLGCKYGESIHKLCREMASKMLSN